MEEYGLEECYEPDCESCKPKQDSKVKESTPEPKKKKLDGDRGDWRRETKYGPKGSNY